MDLGDSLKHTLIKEHKQKQQESSSKLILGQTAWHDECFHDCWFWKYDDRDGESGFTWELSFKQCDVLLCTIYNFMYICIVLFYKTEDTILLILLCIKMTICSIRIVCLLIREF